MKESIKYIWDNHCSRSAKENISMALSEDARCVAKTRASSMTRYFYRQEMTEEEIPVIFETMQRVIREENKKIANLKL